MRDNFPPKRHDDRIKSSHVMGKAADKDRVPLQLHFFSNAKSSLAGLIASRALILTLNGVRQRPPVTLARKTIRYGT
jgi:hypothetical protein